MLTKAIVYLSRRNLEALLDKLNYVEAGGFSACTIVKRDWQHSTYPQSHQEITVRAIENEDYYDREPGEMAVLPQLEDKHV